MLSAFGVDHHFEVSKADEVKRPEDNTKRNVAIGAGAAGVGGTAVLAGTKMPEHSHYSRKTRKYLNSLPAGVHEVDTKILAKKPRKLGARKQQAPYVAAMAQERPTPYSPVPITRYKDGIIQRDNAHSVMANNMKGRKTTIKIEDADGYRPSRRTGEELVRRAQSRYQQSRLKRHTNLSEKKIEGIRAKYKDKSRIANTTKRPHGVVEEGFKVAQKPFGVKRALSFAKADDRNRQRAAGAAAVTGTGVLASTPVRRSAAKVDINNGQIKSSDAKKIVSPGYRPGNKRAIQVMARNLGHLENSPSTVIRYKDGSVIPFDGNHRATARVARGDKSVPVKVVEGGERPAISAARNAYHVAGQRLHRARMNRDAFKPTARTGKHAGESKVYSRVANASPLRSGSRVDIGSTKLASGPTKTMLRGRQAATVGTGVALLGTAQHLSSKKEKVGKSAKPLSPTEIKDKKRKQSRISQATGALGLAALGGTALSTRGGQKALATGFKRINKPVPKSLQAPKREKGISSTVTPLLATSAGLGALGSFNFASYTRAEADKGKRVKKNNYGGYDHGNVFGSTTISKAMEEEIEKFKVPGSVLKPLNAAKPKVMGAKNKAQAMGSGAKHGFKVGPSAAIPAPMSQSFQRGARMGQQANKGLTSAKTFASQNKAAIGAGATAGVAGGLVGSQMNKPKPGTIVRKEYDPEGKRMKRADNYERAGYVGAGLLGAGATHQGAKARRNYKSAKPIKAVGISNLELGTNKSKKAAAEEAFDVFKPSELKRAKVAGRKAAIPAALMGTSAVGAAYGAKKIGDKKKEGGSWSPYVAKSASSAFGIVHD